MAEPVHANVSRAREIPCVHCQHGADDRPVRHEAVCWDCWARSYGDDGQVNREALRAFEAGQRSATRKIVGWLRDQGGLFVDAPMDSYAKGESDGLLEAARDIKDGAPWNE